MKKITITILMFLIPTIYYAQGRKNIVLPNENLIAENIPSIEKELEIKVKKYTESRGAVLRDVHPLRNEIIVSTRFGSTPQLHKVTKPLGSRKQITFFEEPINTCSFEPLKGDYLIYSRDVGGNEFGQLYKLDIKTSQSTLLTDGGRTQNSNVTWKKDGSGFFFMSTKRNNVDRDLYFMNPNIPKTANLILECKGGGWGISDVSNDGKKLLINEYISANESHIWMFDTENQKLTEVTDRKNKSIVQTNASFSKNPNEIWFLTDKDNLFVRLASMNLLTKKVNYYTSAIKWDIENYSLSDNKTKIAYTSNENGINKLYIFDIATNKSYDIKSLAVGLIENFKFTKDGQSLFFSQSTHESNSDVYKLNIKTNKVERYTESELGEIQIEDMSKPKLIEWKSFDGLKITGFHYPASSNHSGKRPVIINIHGGPEAQSMASFLGANNFYTKELGISLIYPNVRGSSGYGKEFIAKDNGFLREDSVKDIGALIDWIATQPQLDKDRILIMGGSYGGYMSLSSSFNYADKIRCSVDIVGISNFNTFLKNTEGYRRDLRRVEYGDERDQKMNTFLEKISPLNNTDKITKPLFIIQGTNDPRVPVTEATQMRDRLKEQGNIVWYLEAKNEGHGFRKKENVDFQRLAIIKFIQEFLLN
jgi:dipeptidyl aminopeptidase/acylaminoacyl peptidase